MSLEQYRARVQKLARERTGEPIFNGTLDHAAIIVEQMFAHSRDCVRILSGKLNARVYGRDEVLEQAQLFLADADHRLEVLIENPDPRDIKDHPFFEKFATYENVEIRKIEPDIQGLYKFHFLVMDKDSYRFEEDKSKHAAIAAFGDKGGAKNLNGIFNILWKQGKVVNLPQH